MFTNALKETLTAVQVSVPAAKTSTVTGSAIDTQLYLGDIVVVQDVAAVTGTTPTLDGKVQSSADGSTGWADVTGATATQVTAANSIQIIKVPKRAASRYIRYVGTIAGTTPSFTMGVTLLAQKKTQ